MKHRKDPKGNALRDGEGYIKEENGKYGIDIVIKIAGQESKSVFMLRRWTNCGLRKKA